MNKGTKKFIIPDTLVVVEEDEASKYATGMSETPNHMLCYGEGIRQKKPVMKTSSETQTDVL